ncbi:MAG: hypothetical protein QF830_00490 [Rhodospirillales bacterium]|jgi:hypothetical protein|nr:hypothetical protein [Rhodospirillales bacterium]MDP6882585.1 hypothetical protein [Rhodospirillales bacterium]
MAGKYQSMAMAMIALVGAALGACGETEAELRAARQQRCSAEGITNKVLFDRCVSSQKKLCRQVYWHHQANFTAEDKRRPVETYQRVMGDLADRCRKFVNVD